MALKGIVFNGETLKVPQEYIKNVKVSKNSIVFTYNDDSTQTFTQQPITVDSKLSKTSKNPVENGVITNALDSAIDSVVNETIPNAFTLYNNSEVDVDGQKNFKKIGFTKEITTTVEKTYPVAEYSVENISTTYGFSLNDAGYFESNNNGVDNSYALCKLSFVMSEIGDLDFEVIDYAESNYDFGIFSNIDTELSASNNEDTTNVYKSYKGLSSESPQTLTYSNIPVGEHYIEIKYRKDSSSSQLNDSLQFKVTSNVGKYTAVETVRQYNELTTDDDDNLLFKGEKIPSSTDVDTELQNKQNKLTAGDNITISEGNIISSVDTKYTAGTGIEISADNVISATGGSGPNVVQTTGQSETDVMSQKATTDTLSNKITKNVLDIYVGTTDTCSDADGNFGQCSQIYKTDGTSYTVRQFLFNKNDFQQEGTNDKTKYSLATDILRTSNISQETGSATDKIMSQDSVTKELAKSVKKTDIVDNLTSTNTTVPLSANQGKVLDGKKVNKTVTFNGFTVKIDMLESGGQLSLSCSDDSDENLFNVASTYTRSVKPLYIETISEDNKVIVKSELQTADAQNVKLTGDQSVGGVKNFTGTFKVNGGTITYDSATDTFTV